MGEKWGFTKPENLTPNGVIHTAESKVSNFEIEYFEEIKTREAYWVQIMKKEDENLVTFSLLETPHHSL